MPRKKKVEDAIVEDVKPQNVGGIAIAKDIEGIDKQISELQEKIQELDDDVNKVNEKIADLTDDINGKRSRVQSIRNDQNQLITAIFQLQGVKLAYQSAKTELEE